MHQKEVLLIVLLILVVVAIGYSQTKKEGMLGTGLQTAPIKCPEPKFFDEECAFTNSPTARGWAQPPWVYVNTCTDAETQCSICLNGPPLDACTRIWNKCWEYCNPEAQSVLDPVTCRPSVDCQVVLNCRTFGGGSSPCWTIGAATGRCQCIPSTASKSV